MNTLPTLPTHAHASCTRMKMVQVIDYKGAHACPRFKCAHAYVSTFFSHALNKNVPHMRVSCVGSVGMRGHVDKYSVFGVLKRGQ